MSCNLNMVLLLAADEGDDLSTCGVAENIFKHQFWVVEKRICSDKWLGNVNWSRYRPGVAQRVDRGIALLFHDRGTRRGWVVSSTPRPHFTPRKDPVPILQEAGWAPGPVWTGGKSRPHRDSIPDRPARSSVAIPTELPGPHPQVVRSVISNTMDLAV